MKDELSPISGGGGNYFVGWSASLVDALDTLWIMDLKDEFDEAVTAAISIDFTASTDEIINVFETTIRYLGGFLATYDLSNDVRLQHKAVEIGEMLLVPLDTPNHMPITRCRWKDAKENKRQEAPSWMLVSELGSLTTEYVRLSQVTGDPQWYDAIDRITRLFVAQQTRTKLLGMWQTSVIPKYKDLISDTAFVLGGMSDSLYDYFPKAYSLLDGSESVYENFYRESTSTASKYLSFRPMTPNQEDVLFSGDARTHDDGSCPTLEPRVQHLGCFAGGMLALGGRIFDLDDHVSMAKKITGGCVWVYNATSVGVVPEITSSYHALLRTRVHGIKQFGKQLSLVFENPGECRWRSHTTQMVRAHALLFSSSILAFPVPQTPTKILLGLMESVVLHDTSKSKFFAFDAHDTYPNQHHVTTYMWSSSQSRLFTSTSASKSDKA